MGQYRLVVVRKCVSDVLRRREKCFPADIGIGGDVLHFYVCSVHAFLRECRLHEQKEEVVDFVRCRHDFVHDVMVDDSDACRDVIYGFAGGAAMEIVL